MRLKKKTKVKPQSNLSSEFFLKKKQKIYIKHKLIVTLELQGNRQKMKKNYFTKNGKNN